MRKNRWVAFGVTILLSLLAGGAILLFGSTDPLEHSLEVYETNLAAMEADLDAHFQQGQELTFTPEGCLMNEWEGEHPMVEYCVTLKGRAYYGFYYSPDNVPLAFQNMPVDMVETEEGWSWIGEGKNSGATSRISDCWFYFEANF